MPLITQPESTYIEKVTAAVKDRDDLKADGMPELLAYSCWRHDWPLPKAYFDSDAINFSGDDETKITEWVSKTKEYAAYLESDEDDPDNDPEDDSDDDADPKPDLKPKGDKTVPLAFSDTLLAELNLKKGATEADVIKAVSEIKKQSFTEQERSDLTKLKEQSRLNHYYSEVQDLSISGKSEDIAKDLYKIETEMGVTYATKHLESLKALDQVAEEAGITKTLLSTYSEDGETEIGPAKAKIQKYANDNKIDFNVALTRIASEDIATFSAYSEEMQSDT